MTTEIRFNVHEWTVRLGTSLEAVAVGAKFSLRLEGGHSPFLSYHEVLAMQEDTKRRLDVRDAIVSSNVQMTTSDMAEPCAILRDHPILRRVLTGTNDDEGLMLLSPHGATVVKSQGLVMHLIRLSMISNGAEAARLLHRYLTVGESQQLEAREIVVIYGLKLAGCVSLGEGAFLAPLDNRFISEEGLTEEEADTLKTFGARGWDLQKDSDASSVFVRDMKWGPGVVPIERDADSAEVSYCFPCNVETVVNLLSIAARCPLATSTRHTRFVKWVRNIHAGNEIGVWGSVTSRLDGWWEECELSGEAEASFKKSIAGWAGFQFRSEMERDALSLATWRLSRSFTRIGGWELRDRILDYAIALEILYRLDRSELTYKLGTRAAWLLGKTPEMRREIFEKMAKFYGIRSAIVHGPTTRRHRKLRTEDYEQACADGRDLACDTLLNCFNGVASRTGKA